jgi:hypothetical protein
MEFASHKELEAACHTQPHEDSSLHGDPSFWIPFLLVQKWNEAFGSLEKNTT